MHSTSKPTVHPPNSVLPAYNQIVYRDTSCLRLVNATVFRRNEETTDYGTDKRLRVVAPRGPRQQLFKWPLTTPE
ncbi:hypothetical protein EVAR_22364_1 [Eumeta japonica]|uniref:Uncharacterized protein n=1 Tax=Eumeta variegata TaxID=151549 RepID=A0A4C1VLS5_EUMVA|nr:hypothetical protein EVAR_22364_1 [Eumeta japonica]